MGFSREATTEFVQFVQACGLKPVIARSFDFEHVVDALEALQKLNAVGKIVVQISED
jgi:D-arabinose 1-dehydrogenase-like Zn-dependent alcohol dehydrogenase